MKYIVEYGPNVKDLKQGGRYDELTHAIRDAKIKAEKTLENPLDYYWSVSDEKGNVLVDGAMVKGQRILFV